MRDAGPPTAREHDRDETASSPSSEPGVGGLPPATAAGEARLPAQSVSESHRGTLERTTTVSIAAVVVHFGDALMTRRCLDSLSGFDEVILVDQPPTRAGEHPVVTRHLVTDRNLGFAASCNAAVAACTSDFIVLVNNDAILEAEALRELQRAARELPEGVAGGCLKLVSMDGVTIQSVGGLLFTADGVGFPRGFGELDGGQYDDLPPELVGVPSGAAALFRAAAWRQVGGMSEEFFCYCEDGDIGLRMVALGWTFVSLPRVVVRHRLSSSTGAHSRFKAFHVERNHFLTMLAVAPPSILLAMPAHTLLRLVRMAADAGRGHGAGAGLAAEMHPFALLRTLLEAWWGALRLAPVALGRRREAAKEDFARTGAFLRRNRASLDDFLRSRLLRDG